MNVEIDGVPYHSIYDPKREALKFYGTYAIEKADVVFHFGWGLGYCGEVLRDRLKETARVFVFEPSEQVFKLSQRLSHNREILNDSRFRFVAGSEVSQFFDNWILDGCQETDELLWLTWPQARTLYGNLAGSLKESYQNRLRDRAANLLTHFQNGRMYFENTLANAEYHSDPDAGRLFGQFRNVPLAIISAGPSLDRNIRELREMSSRCFLMAVDTALRPLLAAGIEPHAVVIADPTELNARHVVGALPKSTFLIAEQAVHISALRAASRRFLFGLGLFPDPLFTKFGFGKSTLGVWGSVATAALDLACRMGANPVITVGQDFAYTWDRTYARNTIFDGRPFDIAARGTHRAADVWGREVPTSENLIAYRDFFVRRIRQTSGVRFINASEGGILCDGVELLSLRDALHQSCSKRLDLSGRLKHLHSLSSGDGKVMDAIEHLSEALQGRSTDCSCRAGFIELAAKEALLRHDQSLVDETILWGQRTCERLNAVLAL